MIKKRVDADQYPQEGISMLHILICDDEPEFASLLKAKITGLPTYSRRRMSIECVTDLRSITVQMARDMDLIFLDIDMGSVNGIQLAAKFREVRKDSILIFVTNYGEYAAEGYEVNAFRFLPKLRLDEKLPDYFEKAVAACQAHARTLNLICDGEETSLAIDTIIYAAHLYCGRPELEGLLASLLHYGIHTFGAKDGNWIEPGGRRWMVLPGYDEEVWNG